MSKKAELKKQIADSIQEINNLEAKRNRSQAAILKAFLDKTEPLKADAEYFRVYTQLIELERKHLRELNLALRKLNK